MKNTSIKVPLALLAGFCIASSTQAALIIDLTGNEWATANNGLGNNGSVMDATNIQPGTGYSGPAFLGGAVATDTTIGTWSILDNGGTNGLLGQDVIFLGVGSTANQANNKFHRAVVFFDQSVFSNGLDSVTGGVTLNDTTSLSYFAKRTGGNPSNIGFVLQADGNYFLHSSVYDDNSGTGDEFTLADPTAVTWNSFDPTVSFSSIGAAATPDFTKVTGIGIWFENERVNNSTSGMGFQIGEITFNAVPEPSTYALISGFLALGWMMVRRRWS